MVKQFLDFKRIFMLSDIHLGVHSNSLEWLENQVDYFKNFFIPLLKKEHKEGDIFFILGDLFDNRQSVDILVSNTAEDIIAEIAKILPVHILCGNHDMYKKMDNTVNSLNKFRHFNNVTVYTDTTLLENSTGQSILVLPYSEDYELDDKLINDSGCDYLFAHADILGMKFNDSRDIKKGLQITKSTIKRVFSGHIHKRQERNKIIYIGSPYHTKGDDIGDVKGVYAFDAVNNTYDFYTNNHSPIIKRINLRKILDLPLGDVKDMLNNNYVTIIIPSDLVSVFNMSIFVESLTGCAYKRIEATTEKIKQSEDGVSLAINTQNDKSLFEILEDYINTNVTNAELKSQLIKLNSKYYNTANTDE